MSRQLSLLAGPPADGLRLAPEPTRIDLGQGAWLDHAPNWFHDPETLLDDLTHELEWRTLKRPMYDQIVDVPRLITAYKRGQVPDRLVGLAADVEQRYGRPFRSVACNLYRDGADSVAWHTDRVPEPGNCIIAIVSVGQPRPLLMRPAGGGPTRRFTLGDGDLFVMGGTTQALWEHAVPKTKHAGPRISIMVRS